MELELCELTGKYITSKNRRVCVSRAELCAGYVTKVLGVSRNFAMGKAPPFEDVVRINSEGLHYRHTGE